MKLIDMLSGMERISNQQSVINKSKPTIMSVPKFQTYLQKKYIEGAEHTGVSRKKK